MSELPIAIIGGFITLIFSSLLSSYINDSKFSFKTEMSLKEILASFIYFFSGALFVGHLFYINSTDLWVYLPIYTIVFVGLVYLTIWDLHTLSIPERFTNLFLLLIVLINFVLGLSNYLEFRSIGEVSLSSVYIGTVGNMLAGVGLGALIYFLHRFTKGKGIGDGDIYIYAALGFVFGIPLSLGFIMISSITGGLIALGLILSYWKDRKKVLKTRIPLMPIVLISFVLTLIFQNQIYLILGL